MRPFPSSLLSLSPLFYFTPFLFFTLGAHLNFFPSVFLHIYNFSTAYIRLLSSLLLCSFPPPPSFPVLYSTFLPSHFMADLILFFHIFFPMYKSHYLYLSIPFHHLYACLFLFLLPSFLLIHFICFLICFLTYSS